VRIPSCFSCHADKNAPYKIDPEFFKVVDDAVNPALQAGLIVFLDVHHCGEIMQDPVEQMDRFLAIWKQITEHYKDAGPSLFFELLNEPNQNMSPAAWKRISAEALKTIRAVSPERTITLSGVEYGSAWSLRNLSMPSSDNTAAIFHYYEPFKFTHQGAMWMQGSNAWIGTKWTGSDEEKKAVTDALDIAADWSKQTGIPVVMNEFGSINTADPASRQLWTDFLTREAEKRGIGWMYWEFCAGFGVFDSKTMKWDQKMLKSLIPETPVQ
jgi:endoglucanase